MNPVSGLKLVRTNPDSVFLSNVTQLVLPVPLSKMENFHTPPSRKYPLKVNCGLTFGAGGGGGGGVLVPPLPPSSPGILNPGGRKGECSTRSLAAFSGIDRHKRLRPVRIRFFR